MVYFVNVQPVSIAQDRQTAILYNLRFIRLSRLIHSKKHRVPPYRYIYLHHSSSWQLLTVTQKLDLEQNFHVQASRYFVCTFHQVTKSTTIKM